MRSFAILSQDMWAHSAVTFETTEITTLICKIASNCDPTLP